MYVPKGCRAGLIQLFYALPSYMLSIFYECYKTCKTIDTQVKYSIKAVSVYIVYFQPTEPGYNYMPLNYDQAKGHAYTIIYT